MKVRLKTRLDAVVRTRLKTWEDKTDGEIADKVEDKIEGQKTRLKTRLKAALKTRQEARLKQDGRQG